MNDHLKLSREGAEFIAAWEGLALEVYICAGGKPTIGIGHVVKRYENFDNGITEQEAYELFADDITAYEDAVKAAVTRELTQEQFDALTSWTYNLGGGNLRRSVLLKRVNARHDDDVPHQMFRWSKAGGRTLRGLQRRRKAEGIIWTEGRYPTPDATFYHKGQVL